MNLILLTKKDNIHHNTVVLRDERFYHIRNILRACVGDTIRVGQLGGLMGSGFIQTIDDRHVKLIINLNQAPPSKLPLTMIVALPRPAMLQRIVRSIAELGVQTLLFINSTHVEKSFWRSQALQPETIQRHLIAGLQQAKDTVLPKVSLKPQFKPFVEDELPTMVTASNRALVAHPNSSTPCPHNVNTSIILAIGPEAGFTAYEIDKLAHAGFESIHLGRRILRVENAVATLAAKLYT